MVRKCGLWTIMLSMEQVLFIIVIQRLELLMELLCTIGDIIGVALDLDNNKLYFSKKWNLAKFSGDPESGATGTGAISITAPDSTSGD
jgi:hypothetical protein